MTLPKKLLRVLRESPLPVSTSDLAALCETTTRRVWVAMLPMERGGVVRHETRVVLGRGRNQTREFHATIRTVFWRLAA